MVEVVSISCRGATTSPARAGLCGSSANKKGVFAGGDRVTGAATVIKAAGTGRDAGIAIDKYLADGEWWDPSAPSARRPLATK